MKLIFLLPTFALLVLLCVPATAAISFTGNYSSNLNKSDGTSNIAVGNRYIIVADLTGDGFGSATTGTIASGTGFTLGSLFGGDEIIQTSTIPTLPGRAATAISNQNFDVSPYAGKHFGLIWFDALTSSDSTVHSGDKYGFVTDASWILPSVGGTYNFTTTPTGTDFTQKTAPGGTILSIASAAPEPSRLLLTGLGLGLFLMRRRRAA